MQLTSILVTTTALRTAAWQTHRLRIHPPAHFQTGCRSISMAARRLMRLTSSPYRTITQVSEPTETMTFSSYGLSAYDVQYWVGAAWVTVNGGSMTGNSKVWKKINFSLITTSK